jgi:hypothetical protein
MEELKSFKGLDGLPKNSSIYENCKNNIYFNIDDQYDQALNGPLVANIPATTTALY